MESQKRFQVFVSSTFEDLRRERQAVIHSLLELHCMPAGMELFPAANHQQWELIRREIESCDCYIVILGGRYGSVDSDGVGYTEKEYRYALEKGKPVIAFIHQDPDNLPSRKTERTDLGRQRFHEFRQLLRQRLCKHWRTSAQLSKEVAISLVELIKTEPMIGWTRSNAVTLHQPLLGISHCLQDLQKTIVGIPESESLQANHLGLDMSIACDYVGELLRGFRGRSVEFNILIMTDVQHELGLDPPEEVKNWSTYVRGSIARIQKHVTDFSKHQRQANQNVSVHLKKYTGIPMFHGIVLNKPKRIVYGSVCRFRKPDYRGYDWGEFAYRRIDRDVAPPSEQDFADVIEAEFMSRWNRAKELEWHLNTGPRFAA